MSNKLFTDKEIESLSKNPYIKVISERGITYTDEFKWIFINEYEQGNSSIKIFEDYGFDTNILGKVRVISSGKRWRRTYKTKGINGLVFCKKKVHKIAMKKYISLPAKFI